MPPHKTNLLQGTLDLLIPEGARRRRAHGLAISQRVEQITNGTFQVGPGSLFPALHRMEEANIAYQIQALPLSEAHAVVIAEVLD